MSGLLGLHTGVTIFFVVGESWNASDKAVPCHEAETFVARVTKSSMPQLMLGELR